MKLKIERNSQIPIYLQIRNQLRDMITEGRLEFGYRLPPERKLAEELGVNRSTVLNAYRELKADGYVESHIGQGTLVSALPSQAAFQERKLPAPLPWRQLQSQSMTRSRDTAARELLKLANRSDIISFAAGVAVQGFDSLEILSEIENRLINTYGHAVLQHTPTEGHYPLRESICSLMESRDIHASTEEVMVLSGSQQGLDLVARAFIDPGDVVIVEEPSFFCALQIFSSLGARIIGIPVDSEGMSISHLANLLERYKPKLIYTMPTFQNPSGAVMTYTRRRELLNLAYRYQVPILEDDPYFDLRYEGEGIPPLKAMDEHGYVMYLSTFSKTLFPGLRVGWVVAPRQVTASLSVLKQVADLHSSSLAQWIIDSYLRKGCYQPHLEKLCKEHSLRRDLMLEELKAASIPGLSWNRPEGGLYIWCTLSGRPDQSRLLARAADNGVAFVPGNVFYLPGVETSNLRLNFTYPDPNQIKEGVRRLKKTIVSALSGSGADAGFIQSDLKPIV